MVHRLALILERVGGLEMSWEAYTRKLVSRIGDEERHAVADLLAEHHAHGRLTQEEFDERLDAAFEARTAGELGKLLADLPVRRPNERRPMLRTSGGRRWSYQVDLRELVVMCTLGALLFFLSAYLGGGSFLVIFVVGLAGLGAGWFTARSFRRSPE